MVFAVGNPEAELMFIGEAPGAEEERQREPFVGPAGQLLTKIINAMGLKRGDVYISNICKFRPIVEDGRPQNNRNRAPSRSEMDACLPFIMEEIRIIQPRAIVALGATAANGLGIEGTVGKLRGHLREFQGTPLMITYHPSYLLRREEEDGGGLREKRLVWEDMLKVMEHLGLPISDKRRGYFMKAIG
jgi:DNA polymerase